LLFPWHEDVRRKFELMKKFGLDSTDIRILSAIQQHGQLSKTKLAEIANISATPCWARLDRLKAAGFIRGFHADIALEQIASFTQVVVTVFQALMEGLLTADLGIDRYMTYIATRRIKSSKPSLAKLVAKGRY
jgi:Lrp/AsnC family transcriptional regulator of ectoine degradation